MKKFMFLSLFFSFPMVASEIDIDKIMVDRALPWVDAQVNACQKPWKPMLALGRSDAERGMGFGLLIKAKTEMQKCVSKYRTTPLISNISVGNGDVFVTKVNGSPIPNTVNKKVFTYSNCSNTPLAIKTSEQITVQNGTTVKTFNSVKTSAATNIKVAVKYVEGSLNVQREVDFSKEQTVSDSVQSTSVLEINKTINPNTVLIVTQEIQQLNAWLDFSGDLILDGMVSKLVNYSSIVPNNRVAVSGQVFNAKSELTNLSYAESACPSATSLKASSLSMQKAAPVPKADFVDMDHSAVRFSGEKVDSLLSKTIPYYDSMAISTGNFVSNIKVRVKSNTNEYCVVTFYLNGKAISALASPKEFLDWTVLETSVGQKNYSLVSSSSCTSGFGAEINYYPSN